MKTAATLFIGLGLLTFSLSGPSTPVERRQPVKLKPAPPVPTLAPALVEPRTVAPIEITVVKVKPKVVTPKVAVPNDGQLSPGKQWRFSAKEFKWVPVKVASKARQYNTKPRGGIAYVEPNTHASYIAHLANDHGFDRAWLSTQNSAQLFALHSDVHYGLVDEAKAVRAGQRFQATRRVSPQSGCPNGQCQKPRGVFRRR